jgi:valyl-tRNA synthetase
VYITGLILDENGQKQSKSKGNIIDPLDLIDGIDLESLVKKRTTGLMKPQDAPKIEKNTRKQFPEGIPAFGTDALRFTFAALATMGREIRFDLGRIEGYRNFCNKLFNAAQFVLMNTDGQDCGLSGKCEYSVADRWTRSRLGVAINEVQSKLKDYRFDLAAQALYEFAWYEYCDWYLELTKPILKSETTSAEQKRGTRQTLVQVLEAYLRLLHPLMPFITEEIWQAVAPLAGKKGDTIMLQAYPLTGDFPVDRAAEHELALVKAAILGPRQLRGQLDVPQSRKIPVYIKTASDADWNAIERNVDLIKAAASIESLERIADESKLPPTALQMVDGQSIYAPLKSLIDDIDAEIARIEKRRAKTAQDLAKCVAKLSNESFVANAPAEVVEQERTRIAAMQKEIEQLAEQARRVATLK